MEILRKQILTLINNEIRYQYPKLTWIVTSIISDFISLYVLWQISRAFVPKEELMNLKGQNYFSYIFWGLEMIRIPSYLCLAPGRYIKKLLLEGTFEYVMLFPVSNFKKFLLPSIVGTGIEFARLLIQIIIAVLFFNLTIELPAAVLLFLVLLIFSPLFFSIGILASGILLKFGRGEALMPKLISLATILSGVYFPVDLFPELITKISNFASPFNHLILKGREIITGKIFISDYFGSSIFITEVLISISSLFVMIKMFNFFIKDFLKYKNKVNVKI